MDNFIHFNDVLVKPRDPPWMTKNIKTYHNKYRKTFKIYLNTGRPQSMVSTINDMKQHYTKLISEANKKYFYTLGSN